MDILFDNIEILFTIMRIAGLFLFGYGIVFIVQEIRYYVKEHWKENNLTDEQYAVEVFELLQHLQKFLEINNFDRSQGYLVMIIPVNWAWKHYAPDSCCLQISIYLHRDEMDRLKGMDKLDTEAYNWHGAKYFANGFCFIPDFEFPPMDIQECGDDAFYVTYTRNSFSYNYKKLMKKLYPKVAAAFPDIAFKFDGSRIHTNNFHK